MLGCSIPSTDHHCEWSLSDVDGIDSRGGMRRISGKSRDSSVCDSTVILVLLTHEMSPLIRLVILSSRE